MQTYLNSEGMNSVSYTQKFVHVYGPRIGLELDQRGLLTCVLVSASALAVAVAVSLTDGTTQAAQACLGGLRTRVRYASMAYIQGKYVLPDHCKPRIRTVKDKYY